MRRGCPGCEAVFPVLWPCVWRGRVPIQLSVGHAQQPCMWVDDRDALLAMDAVVMAVWRRGKADALLRRSE